MCSKFEANLCREFQSCVIWLLPSPKNIHVQLKDALLGRKVFSLSAHVEGKAICQPEKVSTVRTGRVLKWSGSVLRGWYSHCPQVPCASATYVK